MKSLSINKSFLFFHATSPSNGVSTPIIGQKNINILTAPLKQKTDKGKQLVAVYSLKNLFNIAKISGFQNRLDVSLFYLKYVTSIAESRKYIREGKVYVNGVKIKSINYIVPECSIIELTKPTYLNNIAHSIKSVFNTPPHLIKINKTTGYKGFNSHIIGPSTINIPLISRSRAGYAS